MQTAHFYQKPSPVVQTLEKITAHYTSNYPIKGKLTMSALKNTSIHHLQLIPERPRPRITKFYAHGPHNAITVACRHPPHPCAIDY